jgi:hypothetical protein
MKSRLPRRTWYCGDRRRVWPNRKERQRMREQRAWLKRVRREAGLPRVGHDLVWWDEAARKLRSVF